MGARPRWADEPRPAPAAEASNVIPFRVEPSAATEEVRSTSEGAGSKDLEPSTRSEETAYAVPSSRRAELRNALVAVLPYAVRGREWAVVNTAVKALVEDESTTPEEIVRAASAWPAEWGPVTPMGLANKFGYLLHLAAEPTPGTPAAEQAHWDRLIAEAEREEGGDE